MNVTYSHAFQILIKLVSILYVAFVQLKVSPFSLRYKCFYGDITIVKFVKLVSGLKQTGLNHLCLCLLMLLKFSLVIL